MLTVSNSTDDNSQLRRPLLPRNEDSAMASPSSLPSQSEGTEEPSALPSQSEGAEQPSALARGFGLLALIAVVLVPLAAIGLGAWLWYSSSHGSLVIPGASRVSDDLAPSAADRSRVAVADQGIDYSASARGDVYPLREIPAGVSTWDSLADAANAQPAVFPFLRVQPLPADVVPSAAPSTDAAATPTPSPTASATDGVVTP